MLNIQTQLNVVNGRKWTEVTGGLLKSCCPSGWCGFSAHVLVIQHQDILFCYLVYWLFQSPGEGPPTRVPSGTRSRDLFDGGVFRYQLRHENSPTIRMQRWAKSISGDLDIFQFNGPYSKRRLHSLRQWHSYCTNIIDLAVL